MNDSPKRTRSRVERIDLDRKVRDMLENMIDPKIIAMTVGISVPYAYYKIKHNGYHKCFLNDEERKLIAKLRFEKRHDT